MKKAIWWIVVVVVLAVLGAIYWPKNESGVDGAQLDENSGDEAQEGANGGTQGIAVGEPNGKDADLDGGVEADGNIEGDRAEAEAKEKAESQKQPVIKTAALNTKGFVTYDPKQVQSAVTAGKRVALFFRASRCPSCKALANNIQQNLDLIDGNTLIFQVNYDQEDELKEKYGVTSQHTIVYLDENMEAKKISKGIPTLNDLLANF